MLQEDGEQLKQSESDTRQQIHVEIAKSLPFIFQVQSYDVDLYQVEVLVYGITASTLALPLSLKENVFAIGVQKVNLAPSRNSSTLFL